MIDFLPSASHVGVLEPSARRIPLVPQPPPGRIGLEARCFLGVINAKVKNVCPASLVLTCPVAYLLRSMFYFLRQVIANSARFDSIFSLRLRSLIRDAHRFIL